MKNQGVWGGFAPPAKLGGSGGALPPQQRYKKWDKITFRSHKVKILVKSVIRRVVVHILPEPAAQKSVGTLLETLVFLEEYSNSGPFWRTPPKSVRFGGLLQNRLFLEDDLMF